MAVEVKSGVEVCVWVAKDGTGNYVNAFTAAAGGGGRVGHTSLRIFPTSSLASEYAGLLGEKDHVYVSLWPGRFNKTLEEDIDAEEGSPNTIIRLNKLDIAKMLKELNRVMETSSWTLKASTKSPLVQNANSCASFVYKILEIGGIFKKSKYSSTRYAGPGWDFYYATNCHLGDILYGLFNRFGWRGWVVSPKLVQHIAASAAESDSTDKSDTLELMKIVSDPPTVSGRNVAVGTATAGVTAVAAVGAGIVTAKKYGWKS